MVTLSGGADSTICLHWALHRFETVRAISFDYGQRHIVELECAAQIARRAGVGHDIIPVDSFKALGGNALVGSDQPILAAGEGQLPNTFVPGRNLILLTLAAARAYTFGICDLVTGACQTDYSGYPDCRESTLKALAEAISLGMDRKFRIHAPLMALTKAQSILLARDLGVLEWLKYTHTCYEGRRPPCGSCPSCLLRAKGFVEAGVRDPLML